MEERLLQPSKEKQSYGSLDEEDGEEDEKVTVILRREKKHSSKIQNDSSWNPSSSRSSSKIHSNNSKSSSPTNSSQSNGKSNPEEGITGMSIERSQRSSHPAMGASSSSQSSVVDGESSHSKSKYPHSKSCGSGSKSSEKEEPEGKPGPIRRLTSSTSVTWMMRNLRKLLVKYWIWIVALMLMIMSVGGTRVVIYRVFYMFLFLTFILTFQLSYRLWRRILFTFWLIVISYSSLVLVALYSYQFQGFYGPEGYWAIHLHITSKLQRDIGLYKFTDNEWWSLFKELFTPTFLIIIAVIQLKCFHSEFMELTRDEDQAPSSLETCESVHPTVLPLLAEVNDEIPDEKRRNSFTASSDNSKTKSSTPSTTPLIAPGTNATEVAIEIDVTEKVEGQKSKANGLKTRTLIDSDSLSSKRSTHFAEIPKEVASKRTSFNDPTISQRGDRSSGTFNQLSGKGMITRRKTLAEITPVKMDDLRIAATDIRVRAHSLWDSAKPGMNRIYETAWKFLELHMIKVVYFTAFYVAVGDVSVINFVYVLLIAITVPMGRFEPLVTTVFAIWSAVLIISKMLFQLQMSDFFKYEYKCEKVNSPLDQGTYDPFNNSTKVDYRSYIGFTEAENVFSYVWKYLIILLVLTLNQLVALRQKVHRWRYQEQEDKNRLLLFPEVSRKNADDGFINSIKFFLNYGFYKFGLEVTILSIILLIGQRMDIMSVVFTVWLFCHSLLKRKTVRKMWPAFTLFVTIMIPIQYVSSLGFPLILCYEYPWFKYLDPELRSWLFLPDYRMKPNGSRIFYDFIVLLLSSRQWLVFRKEFESKCAPFDEGGSNEETFYSGHEEHKKYFKQKAERRKNRSKDCLEVEEDHPDFFTGKTFLDYFKSYFFSGFYWVTLAVVFLTATGRTNFFGLGYILGCFFFLWNGSEFYLKELRQIMKTWKWIIAYCATVILLKTVLHIVGCVENKFFFGSTLTLTSNYCWISKLLGIVCKCKIIRVVNFDGTTDYTSLGLEPDIQQYCPVQENTSGLLLDGVCFCFLLIQKRIFGSYYFTYLVKDIKAQQVLASRGAELIHEIQAKEVMEQEEAERDVMEKIKTKMDRIRAYQQSIKVQQDNELQPERKSHRQDGSDYDISSVGSADGEQSPLLETPEPEPAAPSSLPTVFSPTPSLPSFFSPSSASTHEGKGYLEVYHIDPDRHLATLSTVPSLSYDESSDSGPPRTVLSSPPPSYQPPPPPHSLLTQRVIPQPVPPFNRIHPNAAITNRTSFRIHQKPTEPLSRFTIRETVRRKTSFKSDAASAGSSVRSGDYYLFDEQALALDEKELELEEKSRKSLIPDPEGDELRRIANVRGISAFMSQLLKGELQQDSEQENVLNPDGPIFQGEYLDTEVGDSSKDSAIVSVDRDMEEVDLDASQATSVTSVEPSSVRPTTSRRISSHRPGGSDVADGALVSKTGGDVLGEEKSDEEEDITDGSWWLKVINYFYIMCWFIESCVISATAKLNHVSRDYRYVSRRLAVEKRALKLLFEMEEVKGDNYDQEWKKTTLEKISRATVSLHRTVSQESFRRVKREFTEKSSGQQSTMKKQLSTQSGQAAPGVLGQNESSFMTPKQQPQITNGTYDDQEEVTLISSNAFLRLFRSFFYTVVSQSEIVCFAMVILNQLINASLLSLPLPIMVFLWGCMSVPRPSKTFWISLITYTEAVVVAKYAFNFGVWPWLDYTSWQPKVVTAETRDQELVNTNIDLALLLFLFFHRFMLKTLGLWDLDESVSRDGFQMKVERPEEQGAAKALVAGPSRSDKSVPGLRKRKVHSIEDTAIVAEDAFAQPAVLKFSADQLTGSSEDQLMESLNIGDERCDEDFSRIHRIIISTRLTIDDTTRPVKKFYHRLLHPPFRICHDLYTYMFVCDFINFFIVVFAFNAFGSSSGESITKYFEDNKVPVPFLTMVMAQFCSMIIDRALYLRKNIKGRLLFHILLVIVIHFWLFFILPHVTDQKFTNLSPPKAWYIFKCVYLLLSAVQVKGGYPTRILGNTFTKKYSYFNLYLFKGYMLVPFLYDMRLIMDWIWTDTSLELDEWSIMEDMFKNLFQRKCELQFQANFPEFRGNPRRMFTKYMLGGAWLIMIVGAIWFPLVIFAVGGTVGKNNRPVDVAIELEISGYVPLARMTATKVNSSFLSESEYSKLKAVYSANKEAGNFLTNYDSMDTSLVQLNGKSTPVWGVSPPSLDALMLELEDTTLNMDFKITWYISRHKQTKTQNMDLTVYKSRDISLNLQTRTELHEMLKAPAEGRSVVIPNIFPNFLRVPEKGEPEAVRQLPVGKYKDSDKLLYRDITITLREDNNSSGQATGQKWFEIGDICNGTDPSYTYPYLQFTSKNDCDYVLLVLFNERIFPAGLQIISGYGFRMLMVTLLALNIHSMRRFIITFVAFYMIVGLYTTFVFLVSRLIRGLFDDLSFKVIYTQMPNVDKVLQLALDIYLVRESREFTLEEDLYGKLLFLYRSPETLVKWTKQIEEDQFEKQNIKVPIRDE